MSSEGGPLSFDSELGGASLNAPYTYLPLDFRGTDEEKRAALLRNAGKVDLSLSPGASGAARSLLNNPTVLSGIVSARHQFGGDGPEIFLDGLYFRNQGDLRMGSDPSGLPTDADAPGNPFAQAVYFRFPSDLAFVNRARVEMFRLVGGAIVPLPGQWKAEADVSYGKLIHFVEQAVAPIVDGIGDYSEALFTGLAPADGRPALRPLADWQAFRDALPAYVTNRPGSIHFENRLTNLSLRLAGPLLRLPGGPSSVTVLLEQRREYIPQESAPDASPLYLEQMVRSAYAELHAPLLPREGGFAPLRGLEIQLAVRHDALRARFPGDFPSDGSAGRMLTQRRGATVFTFGARIVPIPALMLRGSYATGTVMPEMEQFQSTDLTNDHLNLVAPDPRRGGQQIGSEGTYVMRLGGAHEIQQERGNTLALGVVVNPFGGRPAPVGRLFAHFHLARDHAVRPVAAGAAAARGRISRPRHPRAADRRRPGAGLYRRAAAGRGPAHVQQRPDSHPGRRHAVQLADRRCPGRRARALCERDLAAGHPEPFRARPALGAERGLSRQSAALARQWRRALAPLAAERRFQPAIL